MSPRYNVKWLDEITAPAEQWLRRCNGHPKDGIPISRKGLHIVLATSSDVTVRDDGVITWTACAGEFTAEPVRVSTAR